MPPLPLLPPPTTAAAPSIPPAKYWHLSPTYPHWVKLSIHTLVHRLAALPGYEGQPVLFYAAHPIRYVYLVAAVVAIDLPSSGVAILVLDDGSGACVEAVLRAGQAVPGLTRGADGVHVAGCRLGIGSVVKAKGTVGEWRGMRQVLLKRVGVVRDTREEVEGWTAREEFRREVLEREWVLGDKERGEVDAEMERERARERLSAAREKLRRKEREKKRGEYERRKGERDEKRERRRREEEKEMNAGALL